MMHKYLNLDNKRFGDLQLSRNLSLGEEHANNVKKCSNCSVLEIGNESPSAPVKLHLLLGKTLNASG